MKQYNMQDSDDNVMLIELTENDSNIQVELQIPTYGDLEKIDPPRPTPGTRTEPCVFTCGGRC